MSITYYWDNAATTYPKPQAVQDAVAEAFLKYGANPGRGGHTMAYATAEAVYRCRMAAATFFGAPSPENVVFTQNCTMALNMVIKGILRHGGRVLISDLEHNAVLRPLHALSGYHLAYDIVPTDLKNPQATVDNFRRMIGRDTRLIVCTHASNVLGVVLPIREIGAVARQFNIPFVVDAAQTAGVLPIDMEKDNVDFLCVAGHKGLYGPMGTGMLLSSGRYTLPSFIEGGTGSRSLDPVQPAELPDHLESGTLNTPGICGLRAGIEWVNRIGVNAIYNHEMCCVRQIYRCLRTIPQAKLYVSSLDSDWAVPVLSFNFGEVPSEETAAALNRAGLSVRAGLHCAPLAHRKIDTQQSGTVRLAPSFFTSFQQVEKVCKILRQTAQKILQ